MRIQGKLDRSDVYVSAANLYNIDHVMKDNIILTLYNFNNNLSFVIMVFLMLNMDVTAGRLRKRAKLRFLMKQMGHLLRRISVYINNRIVTIRPPSCSMPVNDSSIFF